MQWTKRGLLFAPNLQPQLFLLPDLLDFGPPLLFGGSSGLLRRNPLSFSFSLSFCRRCVPLTLAFLCCLRFLKLPETQ